MKLETVNPSQETANSPDVVAIDNAKLMDIVDKYIMGEPIEKTINIRKLTVVLRAPSVSIVNNIYRDVAKAAQDSYVNMQVESSSNMIAAYVRKYNTRDFLEELGEEYDTSKGKQKIRDILDNLMIEPVRDTLADQVFNFYNEIKQAFTDESLDFS